MPSTVTPRPQYTSTAARPSWPQLPAAVRAIVEQRLGGAASSGPSAGGGFTPGFAAVVQGQHSTQFVKAIDGSTYPGLADNYRREAEINAALPVGVPAPRIRWVHEAPDGWVVLGIDAVTGARMPADPWQPAELAAVLAACSRTAELLAEPDDKLLDQGLRPLSDEVTFESWRQAAAGLVATDALPAWFPPRLVAPLAELESTWIEATAGNSVLHHDLRRDNLLLDQVNQVWICDWNWPCLGASWLDSTLLLATAHADGHDATGLFIDYPPARDVDAEQLDAALAGLCGYFLFSGTQPAPTGSPALRHHQTWCGEVVLRWLAQRRLWRI
ncbi:phosphotransferase [Kitasatospora aureofaciens]|uniref:phosphotransferase family protein n=1 Tax=Kitasatospora aureofaciens TaxID=1894 RepID=UPI001C45FF54|nr:phosphotransferase [Kitasatospora aureofaciens]MBV6695651.1 phosphotransferase [Kitasatospora aureofaciens]